MNESLSGIERLKGIEKTPTRKIVELVEGMTGITSLAVGEPDFTTPLHIREALKASLDRGETHYVPSYGIMELRQAIAEHYLQYFNVSLKASQVLVTNGSTNAIFLTITNLIKTGDEVAILTPTWFGYKPMIQYAGGVPIEVHLKSGSWTVDSDELKKKINSKTKMLISCSPNNPTGTILSRKDLELIREVVDEYNLTVVSDEIYNRLLYDNEKYTSLGSFPEIKEHVVIVNGFAKTYAMTGIRLGYMIASEPIIQQLGKLQGFINVCITPSIQKAGVTALKSSQECVEEMKKSYDERRKITVQGLNKIKGIKCNEPQGAFYTFPDINGITDSSTIFSTYLAQEYKTLTVAGSFFGANGERYLRISYSTSKENIKRGIENIEKATKTFKGKTSKV